MILTRPPMLVFLALMTTVLSTGCQSAAKGPGVSVSVVADPKAGYVPPDDPDQGYGPTDSAPAQPAGHTFHRIDYRHLDGVLVFVEALDDAARSSAAAVAPMNAEVQMNPSVPARAEDFQIASVGGRIVLSGPPPRGRNYVIRTESGAVSDATIGGAGYAATTPGLLEILSDDVDVPLASVYVAPTSWAHKAAPGRRVDFLLNPGRYRVTAWHPILPGGSQDVEVAPGGQQQLAPVTLTVGVNSLPKPR